MSIRPATSSDLARLAEMGAAILARTPLGELFQPSPAEIDAYCQRVLDVGAVFVSERPDGSLDGMIGITLEQHALGLIYADEVAIWVDEDSRGGLTGPRLIAVCEEFATRNGATHFKMSVPASSPRMGAYLDKRGFRLIETTHVKALDGRREADASLQDASGA